MNKASLNQRLILTSEQLARICETQADMIRGNFQRHEDEFKESFHYFVLKGKEKAEFLNRPEDAKPLYLWTQAGAFLHVWILKTPASKLAYEKLIELTEQPKTDGIPPEEYAALQEKYQITFQLAMQHVEVPHRADNDLDYEQLGDIEIILDQARAAIKQVRAEHKSDRELGQALKNLDRKIDKLATMVTQAQEKLEETDPKFIAQETLKKIVLSPEKLLAASSRRVPLLEAPEE